MAGRALVTGATGFVGGKPAKALVDAGWHVRCLVRDRGRAQELEERGMELHEGDVVKPNTLPGAGRDVDVAYYRVHSMGRGSHGARAARERAASRRRDSDRGTRRSLLW
jgi:uncharacterized protein YbjT (DUF2867 family)